MRTLTFVYEEETEITLARPSLADAQVRRGIWEALKRVEGQATNGATMFGYFLTQVVTCKGMNFEKLTVCPADEEVAKLYERFRQDTDEALYDLLSEKIVDLNGLRPRGDAEKKPSAPS